MCVCTMCVVKFTQPFWTNPFDRAIPARGACRRSSSCIVPCLPPALFFIQRASYGHTRR